MKYSEMDTHALIAERDSVRARLDEILSAGVSLDLSRGKPSLQQLDLSMDMLNVLDRDSILASESGLDCRNYGCLDGIPEAKRLMAEMMDTQPENVIVGGNSSLTIMFEIISHIMVHGIGGCTPWSQVPDRKFLCPVPGYDRHFAMTQHFGFEPVPVDMLPTGPDMDQVERLVSSDASIKGIWCVPKYQNPTGIVFSDETVLRFAALKPAAPDFRIFWDNAYCIHGFDGENARIPDIISECAKAGSPDMVYEFGSTSKITFPGSGIAAVAASPANLADIRSFEKYATIGPDKLNQLRHARYFGDLNGLMAHMRKHAEIMRPKFRAVYEVLDRELSAAGIADWTTPTGGYFLSYNTVPGCAKDVVRMCGECGVKFTPAGSTYPLGQDPDDRNIRIAPSFATEQEIRAAVLILALCTKLVTLEKLLAGN